MVRGMEWGVRKRVRSCVGGWGRVIYCEGWEMGEWDRNKWGILVDRFPLQSFSQTSL